MIPTALDAPPPRSGGSRRRKKSEQDQGRTGHAVVDGGGGGGGDPSSPGLIEDMASREKRLKRELNRRAQKFVKGPSVNPRKIADRKTKAHVRYAETLADQAATDAALHEKWLLAAAPGAVEAEGPMERTWRFQQADIAAAVDVNAARKAFDLSLKDFGPYRCDFARNGRDVVLGGRRGHVAIVRWSDYRLVAEAHLRDTVRAVKFLHSGQFFAAAQKKYAYIYDNRGLEIHCLKEHSEPRALDFLPEHFLLVSVSATGVLRYQDTSYGKLVASHRTKLGPCDALTHNPQNAIVHLGHQNGTVTLWSPNQGHAAVKMLCHRGPVRGVAVDPRGNHMVTAGADAQVKVWDLRTYKEIHSYFSAVPASGVEVSQRGMMAVAAGSRVQIWSPEAISGAKQNAPYLTHRVHESAAIECVKFCPYDDALGVGHAGGFSNLIVPGSGEPNYDSMVANPFETRGQRREQEVARLLDKLPSEMIQLDGEAVGKVRAVPREVQRERREMQVEAELAARREQREANAAKTRMKGKNRVSKRYRKKQQNVVDDKKLRATARKEEEKRRREAKEGGGAGDERGPGRTAGAASDAPEAPKDAGAALRRFYK